MNAKDRERLAVSTGLALAGYAVIFLLLVGLGWPSVAPFHPLSPPVSVYVNLSGGSPAPALHSETVAAKPAVLPPEAAPTVEAKKPAEEPTISKPRSVSEAVRPTAQETAPAPQPSGSVPSQAAAQPSPPAQPMPTTQEATVIPPPASTRRQQGSPAQPSTTGPAMSASTSSIGSTPSSGGSSPGPSTAVGKPAPAIAGPLSPSPGVSYPPDAQPSAEPPAGSGGAGASELSGQSKTYFGASSSSSGEFLNPQLAQAAGSGSTTAPPAASPAGSASNQAGGVSSAAGSTAASGATGGAGAGASATPGAGPTIVWKDTSSARRIVFEPNPLVIPKKYLEEIPPTITLTINFQVLPPGTVNALNITPSLGYPELDNLLENWMEEWRFQSIRGDQVAQGKLEYVIQAITAR